LAAVGDTGGAGPGDFSQLTHTANRPAQTRRFITPILLDWASQR